MSAYNYESFGQREGDAPDFWSVAAVGTRAPDFWSVAAVGTRAPDFSLSDVDGNMISLASFAGKKHVLLEFGSIT